MDILQYLTFKKCKLNQVSEVTIQSFELLSDLQQLFNLQKANGPNCSHKEVIKKRDTKWQLDGSRSY
jgi:hypothetical protein